MLHEQLMKAEVTSYEEWFVTTLIMEDGECCGVVAIEIRTGRIYVIRAKTVIMCAGGLGRVYEPSTNALICTGDGIALAYQVGAPLMDMEMVQYQSDHAEGQRGADHRGSQGGGRVPAQQRGRAVHGAVRSQHDGASVQGCRIPSRSN